MVALTKWDGGKFDGDNQERRGNCDAVTLWRATALAVTNT
jgi:hypothetical protein